MTPSKKPGYELLTEITFDANHFSPNVVRVDHFVRILVGFRFVPVLVDIAKVSTALIQLICDFIDLTRFTRLNRITSVL